MKFSVNSSVYTNFHQMKAGGGSCAMNSMVKTFPSWPGLDMSKKVSEVRALSALMG